MTEGDVVACVGADFIKYLGLLWGIKEVVQENPNYLEIGVATVLYFSASVVKNSLNYLSQEDRQRGLERMIKSRGDQK